MTAALSATDPRQGNAYKSSGVDLPARDRGHDADLVAGLHGCVEVLQEADVLVVQVDVHEKVQLPRSFEQAGFDAAGMGLESVEDLADGLAGHFDYVGAVRVAAQRGRESHFHAHGHVQIGTAHV